jgi:protocatechuate 3,4-dioxygenase beta subunit
VELDDRPVGRLLSRREVLALFGAAGVAVAVACADRGAPTPTKTSAPRGATSTPPPVAANTADNAPSCVVKPALTEGPFFVDERLNRSDIRSDTMTGAVRDGTPLALTFAVSEAGAACTPLAGVMVDVWQCDALGVYSDAQDPTFNTKGQDYLRGFQLTDAQGRATFTTIYPGWYPGRTVHIHFKVRTNPNEQRGGEFTSQLFFDDALTDQVHVAQPYARKGSGRTRNDADSIFQGSDGQLTLAPTKAGDGYAATFPLGLQA